MINIIAIEREYGSGASAIACALSKRLGYKVWDSALTEEIAHRLKCDVTAVEQREEKLDSTYYRLVKTFMRGSFEDRTGSRLETLDAEGLSSMFEEVITNIAERGKCIIIGRAAPWFLREREDACRVFLYASRAEKLRRAQSCGRTEEEAGELIDRVDADRAAFVKKYYSMTWPTRELYHLMVNTGTGDEAAVEMIMRQIEILNGFAKGSSA